jgi:hypothetical protein
MSKTDEQQDDDDLRQHQHLAAHRPARHKIAGLCL